MVNGLYTATSGMMPRITQMDNVANNLANISTHGYKKSSVFLRELITAASALDHAQGIERTETPEEVWVDYTQGTFDPTGDVFDIALNGSGFLRVRDMTNNAVYYTRDGHFHLDPNGMMVNNQGMALLDDRYNFILVEGDDVEIMGNGEIVVDDESQSRIGLSDFNPADYHSLRHIGYGLFEKPEALNESYASPMTKFLQGHLEDANVDSVKTMVDMIEIFRIYELGQKAVQIQDQTLQHVVNEVGSIK
jgi:flagellar basal-body rod protein FlgG